MDEEKRETFSDEGIECPYCGHIHVDSGDGENYDESMETHECHSCGRKMNAYASCSWSWTAEERTEEDIREDIKRETSNGLRAMDVSEHMRNVYKGKNPYQHNIDDLEKELEELKNINKN